MEEQKGFDLGLLEEIRTSIEYVAPDMADYLTLAELTRVTHLRHGRFYYGIRYGKKRPLYGVKRGDRWFVHRLDALQWAAGISNDQVARWQKNAQRLGKLISRERLAAARVEPGDQRETRRPYGPVPAGVRAYTFMEAATAMQTTITTMYVYTSGDDNPLSHVEKYLDHNGRVVLRADTIDEYVREHRQHDQRALNRKKAIPTADDAARDRAKGASNVVALKRGAA
jgi:hypothetical protein